MQDTAPEITRLVLGMLQTNCYLLVCPSTRSAMVIDPADSPERILAAATQRGARIEKVLLTHAHMDHLAALPALREATGASVLVHPVESETLPRYLSLFGLDSRSYPPIVPDVGIVGGEEIAIGSVRARIIHTPGHSAGGLSCAVPGTLFTGDTLFAGGVGRIDLPGGNAKQLRESLRVLLEFPGDTVVCPGHGAESTVLRERTDNPYC